MKQNVYFVSGIDTDAGKSYATGYLAREWNKNGKRTITQKFIQTGNVGHSEDIDLHRRIMEIPFTWEDQEGLTMPEIFSYPASPPSGFPTGSSSHRFRQDQACHRSIKRTV